MMVRDGSQLFTMVHGGAIVCSGSWWFMMVCGGMMGRGGAIVCSGSWWFMMVCGGVMVYGGAIVVRGGS